MTVHPRTSYAEAARAYSETHERALAKVILQAIVETSRCSDANVVALRTSEIIEALLKTLALTLALSPGARTPEKLRNATRLMARRLRELTREALADPLFLETRKGFFNGDDVEGHA